MSLFTKFKCSKCDKECINLLSLWDHESKCEVDIKEDPQRKEKEKEKKEKSILYINPSIPTPLKVIAYLMGIGVFASLVLIIVFIVDYFFFQIIELPFSFVLIPFLIFSFSFIFYYGIGKTKKWALYLYGALLLGAIGLGFYQSLDLGILSSFISSISDQLIPLAIFFVLLAYRKHFS